jgi:single-strand DNA-binding protein
MAAGDIVTTIIGNLTADPELRFVPAGDAVVNFTVASTPRTFDRASNEWKDGETTFMRCTQWRQPAENVAESLHRGDRVIVHGRLKSRSYEKDGDKRTVIEMDVEEVGPSLRYASAHITKAERSAAPAAPASDPWATPPAGPPAAGGWGQPAPAAPPGWAQPAPAAGPPAGYPPQPPAGPPGPPPGQWGPPSDPPPY